MRVAVVGAGGVGGYFGGRLAAAGEDVAFIARGRHLEALRSTGLTIQSPHGDLRLRAVEATDDPAKVGVADIVLVAVKLYHVDAATELLPPLMGENTVVIPFQNGVEAVDVLARAVGRAKVAGGTAYVSAVIAEPGVIRHTALDELVFGELDGARTSRLERFQDACRAARFTATLSHQIEIDIWSKFVRLSAFSGVTALARAPIGTIRDDPELRAMWKAALMESIAVARAKGIALPATVLEDSVVRAEAMPANTRSSMLEDLEQGRPLELPWLSGAIVRMGREAGVPTPVNRLIGKVLRPYVKGASIRPL